MRRSTAKVENLAGAIGLVLALPLSFATASPASLNSRSNATGLAELTESTSVLDAWRNYALADLTPEFSWAQKNSLVFSPPSLFDRGNARFTPSASYFTGPGKIEVAPVQVAFVKSKISDTPLFVAADGPSLLQDYTPGIQRYVVAPSISQNWGENSAISLSAILAYQRFASLDLGVGSIALQDPNGAAHIAFSASTGSYGTGMRADFNNKLSDTVSWQLGVQSRVNMDAFNTYRGVYSEPGSFDIPASANAGLGYALTPQLKLDVGVERVMYSEIAPFTSNALPTRFLVLLGSEISPAFAWQDLTVYSVGGSWYDNSAGLWSLHFSTRQQPLPSSPLLQSALEPYLSSHAVEFSFARPVTVNSSIHLAATYAPTEFVLGLPTSRSLMTGNNSSQIEYEALWVTRF
jgi:hypothetical protein